MEMTKEELIKNVQEMPSDIKVFLSKEGKFDDIGIRIFLKPKDEEFYNWYFGI